MATLTAAFGAGACGLDRGSDTSIGAVEQAVEPPGPLGLWHFDDCRNDKQVLDDSSGNGFEAVRSATTKCGVGPGDDGTTIKHAVAFNAATDVVTVAKEPAFELEQNLFVSAWIRPNAVQAAQTVVQKAGPNNQSFTLG